MEEVEKKKFKLELDIVTGVSEFPLKMVTYYFSSLKLLRQGRERKSQQFFCILDERKYTLNDSGEYEPFVVFGKSAIKLSELKAAVGYLELKEKERGNNNCPTLSKGIKKTWS